MTILTMYYWALLATVGDYLLNITLVYVTRY